ncbi:hypothetical protein Hypma_012700 [Hypsizygus marmoreus]|uniref:Uncharacterized protein n=1 Tax=Hypsizygus marmoreus TaxID=39966 RepID=A0A369JGC7_HYPMA|nr:hypothetical protein Hypma_012700 [Hypsizygus marmoreus]
MPPLLSRHNPTHICTYLPFVPGPVLFLPFLSVLRRPPHQAALGEFGDTKSQSGFVGYECIHQVDDIHVSFLDMLAESSSILPAASLLDLSCGNPEGMSGIEKMSRTRHRTGSFAPVPHMKLNFPTDTSLKCSRTSIQSVSFRIRNLHNLRNFQVGTLVHSGTRGGRRRPRQAAPWRSIEVSFASFASEVFAKGQTIDGTTMRTSRRVAMELRLEKGRTVAVVHTTVLSSRFLASVKRVLWRITAVSRGHAIPTPPDHTSSASYSHSYPRYRDQEKSTRRGATSGSENDIKRRTGENTTSTPSVYCAWEAVPTFGHLQHEKSPEKSPDDQAETKFEVSESICASNRARIPPPERCLLSGFCRWASSEVRPDHRDQPSPRPRCHRFEQ